MFTQPTSPKNFRAVKKLDESSVLTYPDHWLGDRIERWKVTIICFGSIPIWSIEDQSKLSCTVSISECKDGNQLDTKTLRNHSIENI